MLPDRVSNPGPLTWESGSQLTESSRANGVKTVLSAVGLMELWPF